MFIMDVCQFTLVTVSKRSSFKHFTVQKNRYKIGADLKIWLNWNSLQYRGARDEEYFLSLCSPDSGKQ